MTVYHLLQVCILVVLLSTSWYGANFSLSYLITYLITSSLVVCFLDDCYKRDGRKWPYFQQLLIWKWFVAYFDGGISVETPLDSQQQYIFCSFPHGTCTASHLLTMTNGCGMLDKVHGGDRRDLCATVLFFVPVFREMLLWLGCVDAGTRTAHHNLKCGRSILIFVGGEKEQLMTTPGVHQIFLNNRKGFVKLALEYGSPLVPMYAFGENEVFYVSKLFMGTCCCSFIFA
jgi:2-acylglycerol O-acyltransferase 2